MAKTLKMAQDLADPMARTSLPLDGIDDIVANVQKILGEAQDRVRRIREQRQYIVAQRHLWGRGGAGSMQTNTTQTPQVAERFGIDFTDTPGMGTSQFSLDGLLEQGVLSGSTSSFTSSMAHPPSHSTTKSCIASPAERRRGA